MKDRTKGMDVATLRKKLNEFYEHPLINMYLAQKYQVDTISEQVRNAPINFEDEESILFKNWLAWSKESPKIAEGLELMRSKIDPDELLKAQSERLKANRLSPEAFAARRMKDD